MLLPPGANEAAQALPFAQFAWALILFFVIGALLPGDLGVYWLILIPVGAVLLSGIGPGLVDAIFSPATARLPGANW